MRNEFLNHARETFGLWMLGISCRLAVWAAALPQGQLP
jgi:hypothetical protein